MRVVVDANVLVSAVISQHGPPREVVDAWVQERFELVLSPGLLGEVRDVLARPRLRRWVSPEVATEFIAGLEQAALIFDDPPLQSGLTGDPDDDYLIVLARAAGAEYLISGDHHLLDLGKPDPPVLTPRQFLDALDA